MQMPKRENISILVNFGSGFGNAGVFVLKAGFDLKNIM